MAFENLQDQLKERLTDIWHRVQESPTYNNLREKYETLTPGAQRGLIAGAMAISALILISIPLSYLSTSSTYLEEYENSRQLIRGLLRASRLANEASSLPPPVSSQSIKGQIESTLAATILQPEQKAGIVDLDAGSLGGSLAPATLKQEGVGVNLKKLNLSQVVEIGFTLQNLNPSVKMIGLEVVPSQPDPHYFDVTYKLAIYSLPESALQEAPVKSAGGQKNQTTNEDSEEEQDE